MLEETDPKRGRGETKIGWCGERQLSPGQLFGGEEGGLGVVLVLDGSPRELLGHRALDPRGLRPRPGEDLGRPPVARAVAWRRRQPGRAGLGGRGPLGGGEQIRWK